jgi:hypothetical protein
MCLHLTLHLTHLTMHLTSNDGYLIPNQDETFDRLAALLTRSMLERYSEAPELIRGYLENIAVWQQVESSAGPKTPTTPTNGNT